MVGKLTQKLQSPSPTRYLGKGKLGELQQRLVQEQAGTLIVDDELTPLQQRNLENLLGIKVIDRTALIIDIFARRARTHEGRLQVALAQSQYLLPRLAGQWSHLERLGGGIGTRGPGETQLETDRRQVRQRISHLEGQLEQVRRHRALYRKQRRRRGLPVVALVGYTNAGKSTLLNRLTGASVHVEDKLFATLDPTTRRLRLPGGRYVLIGDTVGFIQKLPATLVAAFRATLEELEEADLLVEVLDITHHNAAQQNATVKALLAELGLAGKPLITALNKADLLFERVPASDPTEALQRHLGQRRMKQGEEPWAKEGFAVVISAALGWGVATLLGAIERALTPAPVAEIERARRLRRPVASGALIAAAGAANAEI